MITAEVKNVHPKISPLVQGGLVITIELSIVWDEAVKIKTLKAKLETVKLGNCTVES